jgi:hypothetical protein
MHEIIWHQADPRKVPAVANTWFHRAPECRRAVKVIEGGIGTRGRPAGLTTGRSLLTARALHSAAKPTLRGPQGMTGNPSFESLARRIAQPVRLVPNGRLECARMADTCARDQ